MSKTKITLEDLRVGSLVGYNNVHAKVYCIEDKLPRQEPQYDDKAVITLYDGGGLISVTIEELSGIEITENIALELGFTKLPHFTVMNSLVFDLGRGRELSLGNVGTPNLILYLGEKSRDGNDFYSDLVSLHNFDYDGELYAHKLQNLINNFK